jgi:IS30 family transposase
MGEYTHLSLEERKELFLGLKNENPVVQIAKKLSRHKSTIYRERKRNMASKELGYLPETADRMAKERIAKHGLKINRFPAVKEAVIGQLKDGWSPEIIAGRMKQTSSPFWVSQETIYQFIYSNEGKEFGLFKYLLKARPKRGKLRGRKIKKSIIPERVSIHDRPANISTREEFGHLEGDLTFCINNQSTNIGVVIERKTRFVQLIKNQSKHSSIVVSGIFNRLAPLPAAARKSITFDNGIEFVKHTALKRFIDVDTYFCDKHSPWQKGQVEQINVMLHRYLPKKSNLKVVAHEQIELIENKLNSRPRKCLGFKTPAEAYSEELSKLVALQA